MISITCPTRGRQFWLRKSIRSLITRAANKHQLEFLFWFDEDDSTYDEKDFRTFMDSYELNIPYTIVVKPREGYLNLWKCQNHLALLAKGDWIMPWCDDSRMLTKGWDNIIYSYNGQFKALFPFNNNIRWEGDILTSFLIIPRIWVYSIGGIAPHVAIDTYVMFLAKNLEIGVWYIDIYALHYSDLVDQVSKDHEAVADERSSSFGPILSNNLPKDAQILRKFVQQKGNVYREPNVQAEKDLIKEFFDKGILKDI